MVVVGYNFTNISAKRNTQAVTAQKGLEVNHGISVNNVAKVPLSIGSNQSDAMRVEFTFTVKYQEVGTITLKGDLVYTDTKEILEECLTSWKQDKKIPVMVDLEIRKFAYNKSLMQAMNLSDLLHLPAPIPLPKFEKKEK